MINELFKKYNIKSTKQRQIVLKLIQELKDEASSINILNSCSSNVDKSTVYRILDLFVNKNIIVKELNYNNETYYRIREEHGHYFTCIKCHKREKLNDCPIENIENELENKKGYTILNHTVEINGICKKCQ